MQISAPMAVAWDRLRWARNRWMQAHPECSTAEDVARRFGWKPVTYRSHERSPTDNGRGFDADTAKTYAKAFGVSWLWLFSGEGDPVRGLDPDLIEISGLIGVDANGRPVSGLEPTGDFVPRLLQQSSTAEVLEVRGHSMPFFAEDGSLIWYDDRHTYPTPEMMGQVVLVRLDTDELLVRRLLRGREPPFFDLQTVSGAVTTDMRLAWVAQIVAVVPPLQARRIIVRSGESR